MVLQMVVGSLRGAVEDHAPDGHPERSGRRPRSRSIYPRAGMPADDVAVATALASAFATLVMGLWACYPFAQAPGMGLNASFRLRSTRIDT